MSRSAPADIVAARVRVPQDHPALPGHFPGRAIVPGVLMLDAVLQAVRDTGAGRPALLVRVKFTAPVMPETEVEIALAQRSKATGRVAFTCRALGVVVLVGEVECETQPPTSAG